MAHEGCKIQIAVLEMNGQSVPQRWIHCVTFGSFSSQFRLSSVLSVDACLSVCLVVCRFVKKVPMILVSEYCVVNTVIIFESVPACDRRIDGQMDTPHSIA